MKKAVMYGTGSIARGFVGKIFSDSGYEVCFIGIDEGMVSELNGQREYPVKIVANYGSSERIVKNVYAVSDFNIDQVAEEIAHADIMAVSVGTDVLPFIVKPVCAGLKRRFLCSEKPLNIIICEDIIDADIRLQQWIEEEMGEAYRQVLRQRVGFVEASVDKLIPVMTDDMLEGNILKVWVEPYEELPVSKKAFVGEIPRLHGLISFSPFSYYVKRKLFVHKMGYAICAYLGWLKGYRDIWECVIDEEIRTPVKAAMMEAAQALNREYCVSMEELGVYIEDLLGRFENRELRDTVVRAGNNPIGKLGRQERLVGAALLCIAQKVEPTNIVGGIAAALKYNNPEDEQAASMQAMLCEQGVESAIEAYGNIKRDSPLNRLIASRYESDMMTIKKLGT